MVKYFVRHAQHVAIYHTCQNLLFENHYSILIAIVDAVPTLSNANTEATISMLLTCAKVSTATLANDPQ